MDEQHAPEVTVTAPVESVLGEATVGADLDVKTAEREIADAVSARHTIARKYVNRVRHRHPDASPAEVVALLERHYVTAISIAGGVATAGSIAASVGLALIPGASAGKEAGKAGVKVAAKKAAAKAAAKTAAASMARTGIARMVPAGDERLQFEITAIFALALAEIHGMRLDQDQSKALVYGLSNDRVSQKQISAMASDVARATRSASGLGEQLASAHEDWSNWANTLASQLPGTAAGDLVRTVQTGQFDTMRSRLSSSQQSIVEYGVGAVAGGVTRFVFGRDVVSATRVAFAEPPQDFPPHLAVGVHELHGSLEAGDAQDDLAVNRVQPESVHDIVEICCVQIALDGVAPRDRCCPRRGNQHGPPTPRRRTTRPRRAARGLPMNDDRATIEVAAAPGSWPTPWPSVAELADALPAGSWTLVGGLMTQLHNPGQLVPRLRPRHVAPRLRIPDRPRGQDRDPPQLLAPRRR